MSETRLDALRRFHALGGVFVGPRPGSNHLPDLCASLDDRPDLPLVDGEEMESLFRAGLLAAMPSQADSHVIAETEDLGGVEADHVWTITEAGRSALASLDLEASHAR